MRAEIVHQGIRRDAWIGSLLPSDLGLPAARPYLPGHGRLTGSGGPPPRAAPGPRRRPRDRHRPDCQWRPLAVRRMTTVPPPAADLSADEARRIALRAQGFLGAPDRRGRRPRRAARTSARCSSTRSPCSPAPTS